MSNQKIFLDFDFYHSALQNLTTQVCTIKNEKKNLKGNDHLKSNRKNKLQPNVATLYD